MSFTYTEPQNHNSENTWFTPKHIINVFPIFDLDPCTVSYRPFDTAKIHFEYDKGDCGIRNDWLGDVWLNPPYGDAINPFIDKFIAHKKGVMLIFSRTGSKGFQKLIENNANIFLLRKRIHFIHKDGLKKTNAGTDSCLVFFDLKYAKFILNSDLKGVFTTKITEENYL